MVTGKHGHEENVQWKNGPLQFWVLRNVVKMAIFLLQKLHMSE